MTRIAITGAAGNVGREVADAFGDDHDVALFSHSETDDMDTELLDVTDADEVAERLDTYEVVIHLAGASSPDAEWEAVSETNVQGTKHVLDACVDNGVDRLVFASSNHAVGAYNSDDGDPETATLGRTRPVRADAPTSPDSYYGVSKAACENLARLYATRHGLEVVNLRIGWLMSPDDLRGETGDDVDPGADRFARAMWLSPRDCREIHRKAALVDLPDDSVTVNAISRNDARTLTLIEATNALGYEPRDNATETLDE